MSKINAVRFINLNYNNNAMKINDECMQFSGKSTLLSLRNGGGKTVLVQMMTAPFVHRGKQKTKDRPFESYFTTAKPSFILVEWLLDGGAGYVLTGLMVRKNQEISEEKTDALEMMAILPFPFRNCPISRPAIRLALALSMLTQQVRREPSISESVVITGIPASAARSIARRTHSALIGLRMMPSAFSSTALMMYSLCRLASWKPVTA